MYRLIAFGLGLCLAISGRVPTAQAAQQDAPPPLEQPAPEPQPPREVAPPLAVDPQPAAGVAAPEQLVAVAPDADRPVKPLTDGPLHEAFLSPAKDREPFHIDKSPPAPIVERPGVDAPSPNAQWIEGYWDWDQTRKDFVWVTGTWRVPPPGRFWVNGYWKRDDQGWYRVSGFWSDRKTDRIDFRKNGPPSDHPPDEPGESPGPNYYLRPWDLRPRRRRRRLEAGLLGPGPARLGLGPGAVGPPARGLDLPGGLLGPHPGGPGHALRPRPGRQQCAEQRHGLSALYPDLAPDLRPALRRLRPAQRLL